jgi:hypothetical protein
MPDDLLLEQFHLDVFVPQQLPAWECDAMRRTLVGRRYRARLLRAIRTLFRQYRSLRNAKLDVSV